MTVNIMFLVDRPSPKMKRDAKPFEGARYEKRLKNWISYLIEESDADVVGIRIVNQCNCNWSWLAEEANSGTVMIALGNNASKALGPVSHFKLPHPSGCNRLLNDKTYVDKQLLACKMYINNQRRQNENR